MDNSTLLTGLAVFSMLLCLLLIRLSLGLGTKKIIQHHDKVTWAIILLVFLITAPRFFFIGRDPYALIEGGLSLFNMIVAASALTAFSYSIFLVIKKPVLRANLLTGPSFWVMLLFSTYLVSSLWSVWPAATAFRSIELMGYFILLVFIFTGSNPLRSLYLILLTVLVSTLFLSTSSAIASLASGQIYGFMRSNQFALLAAIFLLTHHHLYPGRILGYLFGLILFIGFGSAAALAALVCGLLVHLVFKMPATMRMFLGYPVAAASAFLYLAMLFTPEKFVFIFGYASTLLQKDIITFTSATGRLDLWDIYLEDFKDVPYGAGFWAANRLHIDNLAASNLHFVATHAESGYLMAWTGAGFAGLFLLLGIYLSISLYLHRQPLYLQKFSYPVLLMLFFNSFTYPGGVGGYFSTWYLILAAIVVLAAVADSGLSAKGQFTTDKGVQKTYSPAIWW